MMIEPGSLMSRQLSPKTGSTTTSDEVRLCPPVSIDNSIQLDDVQKSGKMKKRVAEIEVLVQHGQDTQSFGKGVIPGEDPAIDSIFDELPQFVLFCSRFFASLTFLIE